MRIRALLLILLALLLSASCQSTAGEDYDIAFPEGSTLDGTVFWIDGSHDPLGLASSLSERLSGYGFSSHVVPDLSELDEYASISSTGTAFAVSSDLLITNSHVVGNADKVTILIDGVETDADVVRNEMDADLAILKLDGKKLPYAFGFSSDAAVGEHIAVLGYPIPSVMGDECKYTEGTVSALSGAEDTVLRMQISAEIQPGNSGGPVFDDEYRVVGVATEKLSDFYAMLNMATVPQSVNYAIKSDIVEYVASDLLAKSEKASPVDSLEKAMQAVFLVESDEIDNLQDDVIISLSYIYGFEEAYEGFFSYMPSMYYVDPVLVTLYTADGKKIGEIAESSYAGHSYVSESAYDTAEYIADEIFRSWAHRMLPRTNAGERP